MVNYTNETDDALAIAALFVGVTYIADLIGEELKAIRERPTSEWLQRFNDTRKSRGLREAIADDICLTVINRGAQTLGFAYKSTEYIQDGIDTLRERYRTKPFLSP